MVGIPASPAPTARVQLIAVFFPHLEFRLVLRRSPPPGSLASRNEEDDAHALAPSRVLLGIALGLARAGLASDAAKELVKAAAVRPR